MIVIYFSLIISADKHCLKIAIYFTPLSTRGEKDNYFLPRVKLEQLKQSRTKLFKELEPLRFRRWIRRLCTFFRIKSSGKLQYFLNLIPAGHYCYNTRNLDQVETYYCRTDAFKNSFFPYTIVEWNKLDLDI